MRRRVLLVFTWLSALGAGGRAEDVPSGLPERAWAITDAVLDHHISSPTRQQMILNGFEALYQATRTQMPSSLARKTSDVATLDQFRVLLDDVWNDRVQETAAAPKGGDSDPSYREAIRRAQEAFFAQNRNAQKPENQAPRMDKESALTNGLLANVAGGARLISSKDLKVEQQIAGNHYVGLQIALGFNSELKRPEIAQVFEGGPAHRAGVLKGDLIEEIDGTTTEGLELREVIDRLRGLEGTEVTIRVRQAKAAARSYKIVRGVLPRQTIEPVRSFGGERADALVDGPGLISYVKIKEIAGSTPQELRQLARQLEDDGAKALVLDFRGMTQAGLHPTILLADDLLDAGVIGRVRSAQRVETYRAEPDALFRGWPLAVIVDSQTAGPTEWLAAALQDNHRAVIVGAPTGLALGQMREAFAGVETAVPVRDSAWFVQMPTGRLERGDGRPLARPSVPADLASRRRQDNTKNEGRAGGVMPDVVVALPGPMPTQPGMANARPRSAPTPNKDADPAPIAALQRLREALKLTPLAPKAGATNRLTQRDEVQP